VSNSRVSSQQVKHIAQLAQIPTTDSENEVLADAFATTLDVIDELKTADVSKVGTTHQVTGFKNIFREDIVKEEQSFTQKEALSNARYQYQGYFVTPGVLQNKDN